MRKLLQINPVLRVSTSTGRIMQEIGELAIRNGWHSYIVYSRGRDGIKPCHSELIPVGNKLSVFGHGFATRLLAWLPGCQRCSLFIVWNLSGQI